MAMEDGGHLKFDVNDDNDVDDGINDVDDVKSDEVSDENQKVSKISRKDIIKLIRGQPFLLLIIVYAKNDFLFLESRLYNQNKHKG